MEQYRFSGHESFVCRHYWPKKAYDFIRDETGHSFADADALVKLGVGKNMVSAIHFWAKSFSLLSGSNEPNQVFDFILNRDTGADPYLEDIGTIWLFHYFLVKKNYASIYNLFFNKFRRERIEFTKEHLKKFINQQLKEDGVEVSPKTIDRDIQVFLRTYKKPDFKNKRIDFEEEFSGLFLDLGLIHQYRITNLEGRSEDWYRLQLSERFSLPDEIVLFTILDQFQDYNTISFKDLEKGNNSPGMLFALNQDGLLEKVLGITGKYDHIIYSDTAGNQQLIFRKKPTLIEVLKDYYNKHE